MKNLPAEHRAKCSFTHLGPVNSVSRPLMQATDLSTSAIGSVWNSSPDDSKEAEARKAHVARHVRPRRERSTRLLRRVYSP